MGKLFCLACPQKLFLNFCQNESSSFSLGGSLESEVYWCEKSDACRRLHFLSSLSKMMLPTSQHFISRRGVSQLICHP